MAKFLFVLLTVTLINLPSNYSYAADEEMPAQVTLQDEDILIKANGMVCDFCVQSLNKVFKKEDAVIGIYVDMDEQSVLVDTKDGQTLSDEKIKEMIEWGGYDLVSIERLKI